LCNINIRSIRNKTNFVQHFADEFDILVITESHPDNSIQNDNIELYSFTKNIQRRDRQNQTGGGLGFSSTLPIIKMKWRTNKRRQHLHLSLNSGVPGGTRSIRKTVSLLIRYFYENRLVQAHIYMRSRGSYFTTYKIWLWLFLYLPSSEIQWVIP
jgi:hypothetical protein